jgi:hypothetical protein
MTNSKSLILAAVTALSLGVGTAYAQSDGATYQGVPYWTLERQAQVLKQAEARNPNLIQSGSSDVQSHRPALPFDYGTLANPG